MEGLETQFEADENRRRISLQCGDVFKAVDREIRKLSKSSRVWKSRWKNRTGMTKCVRSATRCLPISICQSLRT